MPVNFKELLDAYELFGMAGPPGTCEMVLCKETGKICYRSDLEEIATPDEELPDDIDDEDKYITLPDRRKLDLGSQLAFDFARELLPDDVDEVRSIFGGRGAYQSFKALLNRRGVREKWYDFEAKAIAKALRDWCEVNEIPLTD
ncbi:hypothetical protein [Bradyrhizobium sp. STM 3562]|uniref:hypothetical protein n=1 Tax=Bradyrhizobium sp. STM 3562 TaxID=578924 RepID=UPI00388F0512